MLRLHGGMGKRWSIVVGLPLSFFLAGCPAGSKTSATAGKPAATTSSGSPSPSDSPSPATATGPTAPTTLAAPAAFASIEEVLRANPRDPATRARLRVTALSPADARLRYAALHQLELAPPETDTLDVARALAIDLKIVTDDDRWLAENAIGVLSRLTSDDARAAFAQLKTSDVAFKRDAATALASAAGGR